MATNFGKDTSCTNSLKTGRLVTGARLVGEAAYRRLTTPPGLLIGGEEEENYGLDLSGLIGSINPKSAKASLPGRIRNELLKDERIEKVTVDVQQTDAGSARVAFAIKVSCDTAAGPFNLVLKASDVKTDLIGLTAEAA